jgi:hypothetical protein
MLQQNKYVLVTQAETMYFQTGPGSKHRPQYHGITIEPSKLVPIPLIRPQLGQVSVASRTQFVEYIQKCTNNCANSEVVYSAKLSL